MQSFPVVMSLGLLLLAQSGFAADTSAGAQLAGRCSACHGQHGISNNAMYPNLAGQKQAYLVKQLRDFAAGKRTDPVMSAMVKGLSEQDMENLAGYFSQQKP